MPCFPIRSKLYEWNVFISTKCAAPLRVIGSTLRSRTSAEKAQILGGLVRDVWPAFEGGVFAPFIHKVLPITEAAEAHRIMVAGENRGKIVMTI